MTWRRYKLGEVLKRRKEIVDILPNRPYKLVTIKLYHKGVTLRNVANGSEIKSTMSLVKEGDFVLSGIDARNGAFGIVPKELDGAIVTNDFWCLDPDENVIDKDFLLFLTSTQFFDYICKQSSDGTTQRIRLQREKFFNREIDLPLPSEQKELVSKLNVLKTNCERLSSELAHQLSLVKQLRQAFLREAMQGMLVPQDLNDEPASELLKKLKADKEQLIKAKKIKKEKELPPIKSEEIPFEIPKSWMWCRLGEVITFVSGNNFNSTDFKKGEGIKCIKITNAGVGELVETDDVLPFNFKARYEGFLIFEGDLVLALTRPYIVDGLKISVCPRSYHESLLNQRVAVLRPFQQVLNNYLYSFLKSDYVLNTYKKQFEGKGQQPNLKKEHVTELLFPVPPLREQQKIVAKLEQLMNYCYDLEQSIKQSQTQNEQLLQQVLREALQPKKEYEINTCVSLSAEP